MSFLSRARHAVILSSFSCMASAQQGQPILSSPPPDAFTSQTSILPAEMIDDQLLGRVIVYTADKQLEVRWSYNDGEPRFYNEAFDLSYWPTAAARISDARLNAGQNILVAGKRPSMGTTIIERWELALGSVPDLEHPTVVTKTVVFDKNVAGKKVVRLLEPVNGVAGKAFVQFHDSDAFYLIDATTGALTLIATPAQVPLLSNDGLKLMTGGLIGSAYVYVYQSDFSNSDQGALILHDTNGDGMIEVWAPLANVTAWENFLSPSPFSELYLD